MTNLQSNTEIDLNENNDFFNTLEKANLIKEFIENYTPNMTENKIMALFGEWGSGKSSVLKYIDKQLKKETFSTLYFNSWEYEKDQSLALPLFDALYSESEKQNVKIVGLREKAFRVLGAVAKGFTINLPFGTFNPKDMIEHAENTEKDSYYKEVQSFKESFKDLEDAILGEDTKKRLVVFLDDLDRCEPENILNLLSAIKLFFTFGSGRILFICGVDKEAVNKALKIKYDDIIKANEYLEKIFDFSFNMPNSFDVEKALRDSLKSLDDYKTNQDDFNFIVRKISEMFKAIDFTNPRHIKKITNKYMIFRHFFMLPSIRTKYPVVDNGFLLNKNNLSQILTFFYLMSLFEFDKEEFQSLKDYYLKVNNLQIKNMESFKNKKSLEGGGNNERITSSIRAITTSSSYVNEQLNNAIITELNLNTELLSNVAEQSEYLIFINFFIPLLEEDFSFEGSSVESYLNYLNFISNTKGHKFTKFMYSIKDYLKDSNGIKIIQLIEILDKLS